MKISELLQEVTLKRRVIDWIRKPLYHVTTLENAAKILKSNKMIGSLSAFEPVGTYNKSASPFFVSMATTRDGQYGVSMMRGLKPVVMFEFMKMGEFESATLNYWEQLDASFNVSQGQAYYKVNNESERRVYLNSRNLENVKKYIKRVDVAFYGKTNIPSDARDLLKIIHSQFPKAKFHKTVSGLLTADKGVSFDEIMEFTGLYTSKTSMATKETTIAGDVEVLAGIVSAKKSGKGYKITPEKFNEIFSRARNSNDERAIDAFVEINKMYLRAKLNTEKRQLIMSDWVRGKK